MTDSVSISLDLSHLPLEVRQQVPVPRGQTNDQFGEIYARGPRPLKGFSPLSGTKITWIVRSESVDLGTADDPDVVQIACSIDADLNIPNATKGHNLEHGTSVFAAGIAALWLLKIWLARCGMPREFLDTLDANRVLLRAVTLTYLMRFMTAEEAKQFVEDMCVTARILRKGTKYYASSNETVKMPTNFGWLVTYWKSVMEHCLFQPDALQADLKAANELIARVEAILTGEFLRKEGRDTLESWRNAYADGVYEQMFEKAVRAPMRLHLRHNRPRPEVVKELTPTQADYLQWYLDGNDPRQFVNVVESAYPANTHSKLHVPLLNKCDLDTNIPWADHQQLRCYKLRDVLVYPGDYCPPPERATWCFCLENWPAILGRLKDLCHEEASSQHASSLSTGDGSVQPEQPLPESRSF